MVLEILAQLLGLIPFSAWHFSDQFVLLFTDFRHLLPIHGRILFAFYVQHGRGFSANPILNGRLQFDLIFAGSLLSTAGRLLLVHRR